MYESLKSPPLQRTHFLRRLALHIAGALGLLQGSLLLGMAGYGYFEDLPWRDAFLNSTMLLGGMGPATDGGKVFAALYALYAGLIFIVAAGWTASAFPLYRGAQTTGRPRNRMQIRGTSVCEHAA